MASPQSSLYRFSPTMKITPLLSNPSHRPVTSRSFLSGMIRIPIRLLVKRHMAVNTEDLQVVGGIVVMVEVYVVNP